jgi:hypothetical protein
MTGVMGLGQDRGYLRLRRSATHTGGGRTGTRGTRDTQPRYVARPSDDPNIIDLAMRDVTNLDTHPRHFRDAAQS